MSVCVRCGVLARSEARRRKGRVRAAVARTLVHPNTIPNATYFRSSSHTRLPIPSSNAATPRIPTALCRLFRSMDATVTTTYSTRRMYLINRGWCPALTEKWWCAPTDLLRYPGLAAPAAAVTYACDFPPLPGTRSGDTLRALLHISHRVALSGHN
jgi:hypothetical protein